MKTLETSVGGSCYPDTPIPDPVATYVFFLILECCDRMSFLHILLPIVHHIDLIDLQLSEASRGDARKPQNSATHYTWSPVLSLSSWRSSSSRSRVWSPRFDDWFYTWFLHGACGSDSWPKPIDQIQRSWP